MYSMSDLTQVFKTEIELAVASVGQKLDHSLNDRGVPASLTGTQDVRHIF